MIIYKVLIFAILTPFSFLIFLLYFLIHFITTVIANIILDTNDLFFPFEKQYLKYVDFYFGLIDFSK